MFKKILLGVGALVVVLVAVIATRPSTYHVERSLTMNAPADVIFPYVNDFKLWDEWSPWSKLDPNMEKKFEGPASGLGATYAWKGNDQVGEGQMDITESVANEKVTQRLHFISPMESTATTTMFFKPEGENTVVTWSMDGENGFVGKAFSLVMDMDAMIGKDYENGLNNLKAIVEPVAAAKKAEAEKAAQEAEKAAQQASATDPNAAQPADAAAGGAQPAPATVQ